MGMFDWVNAEIYCKKCGQKCDCQSKSGACVLETIDPTTIDAFHAYCSNCRIMYNYSREPLERVTCRETPYSEEEIKELGFTLISGL